MRGARANGERIKRLRKSQGLTQERLAQFSGCDAKTVRSAERGHSLDLNSLGRIAGALAVPFEIIIKRDDESSSQFQVGVAIVREYWQAFVKQDLDAIMEAFHNDAVVRLPGAPEIPFAGQYRGKEQIRRMHEITFATAQTEPLSPDDTHFFGSGDYVFVRGSARLRDKASGKVATLWVTHAFRLKDLMIIELTVGYDSLEMSKVISTPALLRGPSGTDRRNAAPLSPSGNSAS